MSGRMSVGWTWLDRAATIAVLGAAISVGAGAFQRKEPAQAPATAGTARGPQVEPVRDLTTSLPATVRGAGEARVVVIEFSDYQCPYCAKYARESFPQVMAEFVDTSKIRYAFRNFPLQSIHPLAFGAARAAECAGSQGRFWKMHERLFADSRKLDDLSLVEQAKSIPLDMAVFGACLGEGAAASKIREDITEGERLGVTATPTFLVGVVRDDGKVDLKLRFRGAVPYDTIRKALNRMVSDTL